LIFKCKTKELYIFARNLQKSLETYADRKTNKKYLLTHQSEQFMRRSMTKIMATLGLAAIISLSVSACQGENDTKQQDKTTTPHSMDKDS